MPLPPVPSMADIAKRAGVAKSTVSMALRDDPIISEKQRKRIRNIATKMGYQTNALVARLMQELRSSKMKRHVATLAFVNASLDNIQAYNPPSSILQGWESGARSRAEKLGYSLDSFWLHEPGFTPSRLAGIFRARSVQGIVLHSINDQSRPLLDACQQLWSDFPVVVIGRRLDTPALSYVGNDQYSTSLHACKRLLALGYKRIGLHMPMDVDNASDRRFEMGYRAGLEQAKIKALPIFQIAHPDRNPETYLKEDSAAFAAWYKKHRLDACLAVNGHVIDWARCLGIRVPDQLGVALLYLSKAYRGKVAGMEHRLEWTGMAAIDVLVSQILRNEPGVPPFQQGTLTESTWMDGPSVRSKAP
jgi:LacI family transcriptional regulator